MWTTRSRSRYPLPSMFQEPEFLICLTCETPTYEFDYVDGKLTTVICNACGEDDPKEFLTETEFEELS